MAAFTWSAAFALAGALIVALGMGALAHYLRARLDRQDEHARDAAQGRGWVTAQLADLEASVARATHMHSATLYAQDRAAAEARDALDRARATDGQQRAMRLRRARLRSGLWS